MHILEVHGSLSVHCIHHEAIDAMFLFKKLLSGLIMPLSLCLLILLAGLLFLWFSRKQKTGKIFTTAGFVFLLALVYGWGFAPALKSLEREYPPLVNVPADAGIQWVVVLGGGSSSDSSLPLSARLTDYSLSRVVEGIRLYRQLPGGKLILAGGHVFGGGSDAETMRALALELGVNPADILTDMESQDTETQAVIVKRMVGGNPVILVTSASHMPRALGLFKRAGVDALPAPTNYLVQTNDTFSPTDVFPGSGDFLFAERVVYEYLGMAWAKLRGLL